MKKCTNCGAEILEGENFCKECGTPVQGVNPQIDPFNIGVDGGNMAPPSTPAPNENQVTNNNPSAVSQKVAIPNPVLQTEAGSISNDTPMPSATTVTPKAAQVEVNNPQINNIEENANNNPANNEAQVDVELLDAFIGNNKETIKNKSFSWCTFLFSYIYLFYRKMWLYGVIVFLLSGVLPFLIFPYGILLVFIGLIVFAFKTKELYLKDAQDKIRVIIEENPGKTKEEIKALCSKKGGTTIVPVIIYLILSLVLSLGLYSLLLPELRGIVAEGTSQGIIEKLKYSVPSGMAPSTANDDVCKGYTSIEEPFCHISLATYSSFTYNNDPEVYLEKSVFFDSTDVVESGMDVYANDIELKLTTVEKANEKKYYYATLHDKKIYTIEYSVKPNEDCENKYKSLLSSLEFEE